MDNDKYTDLKTEIVRLDQKLLNIEEKVNELKIDISELKSKVFEILTQTHSCTTNDKLKSFAYDVIKLLVAALLAVVGLRLGGV